MTLVLAVACQDAIVMAADSAATFPEGIKQPTVKIRPLGNVMLWGASGHEGMIQDIEIALTQGRSPESYMKSAQHCRKQLRQVLKPVYQAWKDYQVPIPPPPYNQWQTAHLLFVGFLDGKPRIIEVEPNLAIGQMEDYGHHAIGSAAQIAQARMYPHRQRYPTLDWGKVIAYRTMKEAIDIAASGVAEPIHLWSIEPPAVPGAFPRISKVTDRELRRIEYGIEEWRAREDDAFQLPAIPPSQPDEPQQN